MTESFLTSDLFDLFAAPPMACDAAPPMACDLFATLSGDDAAALFDVAGAFSEFTSPAAATAPVAAVESADAAWMRHVDAAVVAAAAAAAAAAPAPASPAAAAAAAAHPLASEYVADWRRASVSPIERANKPARRARDDAPRARPAGCRRARRASRPRGDVSSDGTDLSTNARRRAIGSLCRGETSAENTNDDTSAKIGNKSMARRTESPPTTAHLFERVHKSRAAKQPELNVGHQRVVARCRR